jgi:hypothetical protein
VPQPGVAKDDIDAQLVDDQKFLDVRLVADSHLECGGARGRDGAVLACQMYGGPPPGLGLDDATVDEIRGCPRVQGGLELPTDQ